jgi:hypothetical protein
LPGDVLATVQGTTSSQQRDGQDYMHIDTLDIDLNVKTVRMLVKKVFNNNRILSKCNRPHTSASFVTTK